MLLSEFFKGLSLGELSNLSLGSEGAGQIEAGKEDKLIHYTNEGLLRLHSRFVLIESDLLLEQREEITSYKLSAKFAMSNTQPDEDAILYINDGIDTFQDDVIKILAVVDANGRDIPLNDTENAWSMFTPTPDTLQVPAPQDGAPLSIVYQARHPKIAYGSADAEIMLPAVLEPALAKYVAHLTYSHMNGQENAVKAAEHLQRYEEICAEVERNDLVSSSSSTSNTRFEKGGWI